MGRLDGVNQLTGAGPFAEPLLRRGAWAPLDQELVAGLPVLDEVGAVDINGEEVERAFRRPARRLLKGAAVTLDFIRVADPDGAAAELELTAGDVPVGDGALKVAARVAQKVQSLA